MDEFKKILDSDERIIKFYKPRKSRFTIISLFASIPAILFATMFLIIGIVTMSSFSGEAGSGSWAFVIFSTIFLIIVLLLSSSSFFRYAKTGYCITNKRIIISSGFIGIDFKSLNISSITGVDVQVDALDKMVKPNTGTIYFSSPSIVNTSNKRNNGNVAFAFACIDNPYDVYKEIKEIISNIANY